MSKVVVRQVRRRGGRDEGALVARVWFEVAAADRGGVGLEWCKGEHRAGAGGDGIGLIARLGAIPLIRKGARTRGENGETRGRAEVDGDVLRLRDDERFALGDGEDGGVAVGRAAGV